MAYEAKKKTLNFDLENIERHLNLFPKKQKRKLH